MCKSLCKSNRMKGKETNVASETDSRSVAREQPETTCANSCTENHGPKFMPVLDSLKRRIRGLYIMGLWAAGRRRGCLTRPCFLAEDTRGLPKKRPTGNPSRPSRAKAAGRKAYCGFKDSNISLNRSNIPFSWRMTCCRNGSWINALVTTLERTSGSERCGNCFSISGANSNSFVL